MSLELNNDTDFFMPSNSSRVDFRMITGNGDQDEITFVIDESVDTCFDIAFASPVPLYMGPDRRLVLPPYDLSNLQPAVTSIRDYSPM